jgi:hypothetical protein
MTTVRVAEVDEVGMVHLAPLLPGSDRRVVVSASVLATRYRRK